MLYQDRVDTSRVYSWEHRCQSKLCLGSHLLQSKSPPNAEPCPTALRNWKRVASPPPNMPSLKSAWVGSRISTNWPCLVLCGRSTAATKIRAPCSSNFPPQAPASWLARAKMLALLIWAMVIAWSLRSNLITIPRRLNRFRGRQRVLAVSSAIFSRWVHARSRSSILCALVALMIRVIGDS